MDKLKALMHKKIGKIPVIYIIAVVAAGLAYYAYKLKPASTGTATDTSTDTGTGTGTTATDPLASLDTQGTVTVAPATPTTTTTTQTNADWGQKAIQYLITGGASVNDAQTAITLYLQGANLTYDQGVLRDKAVANFGIPPEPLETVGSVTPAPAQKQFNNFPGTHTVKGSNDNTPGKLSALYYGVNDSLHTDLIVEHNQNLGPKTTTYNIGTVVTIPAYNPPKYYTTTTATHTLQGVASKNGLSLAQVQALNPLRSDPLAVGMRIRTG